MDRMMTIFDQTQTAICTTNMCLASVGAITKTNRVKYSLTGVKLASGKEDDHREYRRH